MFAASVWAFEGLPSLHAPLTLVVDSEKPIPSAALQELQSELNHLLMQGQRRVEWKLRKEMQDGAEAADLVVVKFRGSCRMETAPVLLDERGPLAFTHTSDGEVLPFSEVLCDKVKAAARSAMHGGQLAQGDRLMGRAMARVLAHEIWHMTSNTLGHGKEGIAKSGLTGAQLIGENFRFHHADSHALTRKTAR